MTSKDEAAVIRAAMRLYRHWVNIGPHEMVRGRVNHWYPLCSEKEAKAFCRACKAMLKDTK